VLSPPGRAGTRLRDKQGVNDGTIS
jgi:hypothetical protein